MFVLAYVDPGSGSLIWQFLIVIGVGSLFYLKNFFSFLKLKILRKKKNRNSNDE